MTTKKCNICKIDKPFTDFHRYNRAPDGLQYHCKQCGLEYRRTPWAKKTIAKWKQTKSGQRCLRDGWYKRTYGITLEQYNELLTKQSGVCAICGNKETALKKGKIKSLGVDHDHTTGKVRGLLCDACNRGLGSFKEDKNSLLWAVGYLSTGVNIAVPIELLGE